MEALVHTAALAVALVVELGAVALILVGAVQAFIVGVPRLFGGRHVAGTRHQAWRGFATWLLLALEFELGADVVRSLVAPTWTEIGRLAAIAAIRTFLNLFLERDVKAGD